MELLKNAVSQKIKVALDEIEKIADIPEIKTEYARDENFGDYACTIAMDKRFRAHWAKNNPKLQNPKLFAESIAANLQKQVPEFFSKVEIAGPGFINLSIADQVLYQKNETALLQQEKYGHSSNENPRRIIFEYVSANPTGPLNIVSARAAALGDSCCNLLAAAGERVHREFYVNDFGNQVTLLGYSSLLRYAELAGIELKFAKKNDKDEYVFEKKPGLPYPAEGYHGQYLIDAVRSIYDDKENDCVQSEILEELKSLAVLSDCDVQFYLNDIFSKASGALGAAVLTRFLESQKRDLQNFNVRFDNFFLESSLHNADQVMEIRKQLAKDIYKEDDKEFFRSTAYGDDKDRVIVRDDGRPTYLLADIAYHNTKIQRGFDQIYNIWGPDHHGYIKRLSGALQSLGLAEEKFQVLIAQQVNLLEDGEQMKMSKRAGKVITMSELMEEIPVDVIRYFFVMRSFESHMDFDLNEAKDTTEKNPYYYVAYAHARIKSIFRKVQEEKNLEPGQKLDPRVTIEWTLERRRLLWLSAKFPEEVYESAMALEPHRMINYLYTLASALSTFYARPENRIISQDDKTAVELLTLLNAVSICLKNGLNLLGMQAPEKM